MLRTTTLLAAIALTTLLAAPAAIAETRPSPGDSGAGDTNPYLRTDLIRYTYFGIGLVHLSDHVLRDDHSGFPFKKEVTPFTIFGLGVPAYFIGGFIYDGGPLYWLVGDSVILASALVTHLTLEPPKDIYRAWTDPDVNRLGIDSPGLGRAAQVITFMISVTGAAHVVSNVLDGREHGWTWKRSHASGRSARAGSRIPSVAAVPYADGVMVGTGWTF